jgi:hypothetical protein
MLMSDGGPAAVPHPIHEILDTGVQKESPHSTILHLTDGKSGVNFSVHWKGG